MELSTDLHIMPELRKSGAVLLLPLLTFMACVGIASYFIFLFVITTFMEQTYSWKADRCCVIQIPFILWNRNSYLPLVPILKKVNPVRAFPNDFIKVHFNIIFPPMAGSSSCSPYLRFPPPKTCMSRPSPPYVPHAPPISFFLIWSLW